MPVTYEDAELRVIGRFLAHLFGIPLRDDAAAHAETQKLIQNLTTFAETKMTQAADDIAQLQGDVSALTGAFTTFQAKVQTDAQAAAQKAADLQTQLDAAKAAAAASAGTVPPDVQSALDAAHAASQALVSQISTLVTSAAAPTAAPAPASGTTTSTEGVAQPDQA